MIKNLNTIAVPHLGNIYSISLAGKLFSTPISKNNGKHGDDWAEVHEINENSVIEIEHVVSDLAADLKSTEEDRIKLINNIMHTQITVVSE